MLNAIEQKPQAVQVSPAKLGEAWHVDGRQVQTDAVIILAGSGAIIVRGYVEDSDEPAYFNPEDLCDTPEDAFNEGESRLGRKLGLALKSA